MCIIILHSFIYIIRKKEEKTMSKQFEIGKYYPMNEVNAKLTLTKGTKEKGIYKLNEDNGMRYLLHFETEELGYSIRAIFTVGFKR
jgi:hypothetical protein